MRTVKLNDLAVANSPAKCEMVEACSAVLTGGRYLHGQEVRQFEQEWADYCGQRYCVSCGSGTDAVTLAGLAMPKPRPSALTIPGNTTWYTADGLHRAGYDLAVQDIRPEGGLDAPTTHCMAVPLYGAPPINDELRHCILFDAAHAHGWKPPLDAVAAWSFYPTKTLGACGDAGAVTTNDTTVYQELRHLACDDDVYRCSRQIITRMTTLQASFLSVKLKYLDRQIEEKRQIAEAYKAMLPACVRPAITDGSYYLFVIRAPQRDLLQSALAKNGIETKVHYSKPVYRHPADWAKGLACRLPETERWCDEVLSLPCYPGLTHEEVAYVADEITRFYAEADTRA